MRRWPARGRHEITAEQFAALDALRRELATPDGRPDPLAVADREDALADWLADHDVAEEWLLAPPLAAAGVDLDWCERVAEVAARRAPGPGARLGGQRAVDRTACWRGEGVHRPDLRPRRAR